MDQSNTVLVKRTLTLRIKPTNASASAASKASIPPSTPPVAADIVPLRQLTGGRKALKIAHGGETYVLQITKANKLILTKPKIEAKV